MSNGLGFSKVQIRANLWVSKVRPRNLRASCEDFIDHLRFLYDVWYLTCWLRRWDCAWADGKMLLKSFACDVQTQRYMLISMRSKQLCYNRSVCSQTSSQVQPLSDNTEATPPRIRPLNGLHTFVVWWHFDLLRPMMYHVRSWHFLCSWLRISFQTSQTWKVLVCWCQR